MLSENRYKHILDHPTRRNILKFLIENGESYNAKIARNLEKPNGELGMDESTVHRDLQKLQLNKYIEISVHPETDKQKYYVATYKGREELALWEKKNRKARCQKA